MINNIGVIFTVIGAIFFGVEFGYKVGIGTFFIAWALMPYGK